MISIKDFILNLGEYYLPKRKIKAGHNGPYFDSETLVRNYSHWLITFAKCYELSGKNKYKEKVEKLANYLCSKKARPLNASFYHRKSNEKDKCNGLIGQAWTIEALVKASKTLDDNKYLRLAEKVFMSHKFNKRYGLWHRLEINGKTLTIDKTFNHQLWFAASGSLVYKSTKNKKIESRINTFLNNLNRNLTVLESGLIYHPIERSLFLQNNFLNFIKVVISFLKKTYKNSNLKYKYKSIGYQTFNLYAFAILKQNFKKNLFWQKQKFKKALSYMDTKEFTDNIDKNKYSFPYNAPGFEIPYIKFVFNDNEKRAIKIAKKYLQTQINKTYNKKAMMFEKNTPDANVLTARIYEITRLPNDWIKRIEIKI